MSSLSVLLAADTLGLAMQLPGLDTRVLQALLVATTVQHLLGPVLTKWSLCALAQECPALAMGDR